MLHERRRKGEYAVKQEKSKIEKETEFVKERANQRELRRAVGGGGGGRRGLFIRCGDKRGSETRFIYIKRPAA
jgi:hypothetical protein